MNLQTPSVPKEVLVECFNCHARNTLRKSVVERPSDLEANLIQVFMVCPDCGHEKHCYFMSPKLRAANVASANAIKALSMRRTQENLNRVLEIKEKYKNLFDEEQSKYQAILGVVEILEQDDGRTA